MNTTYTMTPKIPAKLTTDMMALIFSSITVC
jgi:hypothetical protein